MALTTCENYLRNASLQGHEWIPQTVAFSPAYCARARADLEAIVLRHPPVP